MALVTSGSLTTTPVFRQHRLNRGSTDEGNTFSASDGLVPSPGHRAALVHMTPAGGLTSCDLEILFWNDRTSSYVPSVPATEFADLDVAQSMSFDPKGRRFLVAISALEGAGAKSAGSIAFPNPTSVKATGSFVCDAPTGENYVNGHGFVIGGMNYEFRLSGGAAQGWTKVDISAAVTGADVAQAAVDTVNAGNGNPRVVASRDGATVNFEAIRYGAASNGDIGKVTGTPITVSVGGMTGGSDGNYPEGCYFVIPAALLPNPFTHVFTYLTEDEMEGEPPEGTSYIRFGDLMAMTGEAIVGGLKLIREPPPPMYFDYTVAQGEGGDTNKLLFEARETGAQYDTALTKSANCPVTLVGITGGVDDPAVSIDVAGVK